MAQVNANDAILDSHDDTNNALRWVPVAKAFVSKTVTIANGASLSDATSDNDGYRLVGIIYPAAWTAANLSFQASHDGVTYGELMDPRGNAVGVTSPGTPANAYVTLSYELDTVNGVGQGLQFPLARYLKVRSGTSGSPTNQGAARVMTLIFEPLR